VIALKALHSEVARLGADEAADDADRTVTLPEEIGLRLEREARAVARLDHPNVTRILDVGSAPRNGSSAEAPVHYLVLERVHGETLRDRLRREGLLSPTVAADILEQAAAGLDAVHAAGVVHQDIKPGNILLESDGGVKITDFGIARRFDE